MNDKEKIREQFRKALRDGLKRKISKEETEGAERAIKKIEETFRKARFPSYETMHRKIGPC